MIGHDCFPSRLPGLALAAVSLLSGCASGPGPQAESRPPHASSSIRGDLPGGFEPRVPADAEIADQIREALDFRRRGDFDRFLDAVDPGELVEHATLSQIAIDRGIFGLDDLFIFGDELFDYEFRPRDGLGNALGERPGVRAGRELAPNSRRVHEGEFGGPDSHSCATCHFKGGPDGAGTNTQNAFLRSDGDSTLRADVRNPPHLLGLGPVQALAIQMSADLRQQRETAAASAAASSTPIEAVLQTNGVGFGTLRVLADGSVDTSRVEGIDPDLVVKPFGWKGHQASLQGMVEESFRIHMGILSAHDQYRARDGAIERGDYGDGIWYDVDRDGMTLELDEGMLTTMVAYLAQLEAPVMRPPQPAFLLESYARGQALFAELGCAGCHRPVLELRESTIEIRARGAELAGRDPIRVDVVKDGRHPKVEPQKLYGKTYNVHLFSDLKRHDMGPELATPCPQAGIPASVFLTRSLWGLASTAPYLHDGRAPTVHDAIVWHGGEAAGARGRYLALESGDRAALQVFLLALDRKAEIFVP